MPVAIEDRPIEKVREEVIDLLIMNYSHGKLSYEAFERRLDKAMASTSNQEIFDLSSDLEVELNTEYAEKKEEFTRSFNTGSYAHDDEVEDVDKIINVLSDTGRSGAWKVGKNIRIFSFLSNAKIDFTDAIFTQPVVKVKIYSLLSDDRIYLPEGVNLVSKAFGIIGSVNNKFPANSSPNAPTIVIEGYSIISSINIKIKKTVKDKFVQFADVLKKMFG
jgi:hypothetical protein